MTVLADIAEAFDDLGCTGLTIWLDQNQHIQVSMRGRDGVSWSCHTHQEVHRAVHMAVEEYLEKNEGARKPRQPKDTSKRKRDLEDLV